MSLFTWDKAAKMSVRRQVCAALVARPEFHRFAGLSTDEEDEGEEELCPVSLPGSWLRALLTSKMDLVFKLRVEPRVQLLHILELSFRNQQYEAHVLRYP
mgnify:CR=1 FL=1